MPNYGCVINRADACRWGGQARELILLILNKDARARPTLKAIMQARRAAFPRQSRPIGLLLPRAQPAPRARLPTASACFTARKRRVCVCVCDPRRPISAVLEAVPAAIGPSGCVTRLVFTQHPWVTSSGKFPMPSCTDAPDSQASEEIITHAVNVVEVSHALQKSIEQARHRSCCPVAALLSLACYCLPLHATACNRLLLCCSRLAALLPVS